MNVGVENVKAAKGTGGGYQAGMCGWDRDFQHAHVYLEEVCAGPPRAADTAVQSAEAF